MNVEQAIKWAEDASTIELMESAVFNLFQHISDATLLTDNMLQSADEKVRTGGYNLACRIIKSDILQPESLYNRLFEQADKDLKTSNRAMLHAIVNCLTHISTADCKYAETAESVLTNAGY